MLKLKNKYSPQVIAVLICFLLFFLDFINLFNLSFYQKLIFSWKERNYQLLQTVLKPVHRATHLWNLTSRLEDLQYRYAESSAELSRLKYLEEENQALRQMLENSDRKLGKTLIAAPIISFSQPVVSVGSVDGVAVGAAVFSEGNLLGFVKEVDQNFSRIELLSQMTERGVLVETESGIKGLLKGDGRNILLTEVSSEEQLDLNQMVMTSGQEGVEKGLYIGRVRNLRVTNSAEATQIAELEQLINFYELSLVEVK